MEILIDACAIMAVIVKEPERELVIKLTQKVFDAALTDDVIVSDKNGVSYKILPIKNVAPKGKSPFEDVPFITADVTTLEIVELIRENRAGA